MKNDFLCPKCKGYLNVGDQIIFIVKEKKWKGGLLILSPDLGDYKCTNHSSFKLDDGEHVDFLCPICHADLMLLENDKLAKVIMRDENHKETAILFSRVKGERCTFKVAEQQVGLFGEHAQMYMDFINYTYLR